jgi:flagellar basal-body rod protein FlgG
MDAQQTNLDTISNNLANVSTTAYKRVRPIFEDLLYQNIRAPGLNEDAGNYVPAGLQAGNGARVAATQRINSAGSLVQSQNPLDMAINGNGFFAVSTPNGVAYTRAGNFMRNDKGQIVTASGSVLLGQSSATSANANANAAGIVIPSKATSVSIGSDGTVSYNLADLSAPVQADQIAMVNFVNPTGLASAGGGLYFETMSSGEAQIGVAGKEGIGTISQFYTEQSNVNVAEELVSLIAAQRAYEINTRAVTATDQILQRVSNMGQ